MRNVTDIKKARLKRLQRRYLRKGEKLTLEQLIKRMKKECNQETTNQQP